MMDDSALVGIVTRNRPQLLKKAIQSVITQGGANIRMAVLDDGSTDETIDLPSRFPDVTWLRRESSGGYISARNELMADAIADYFVSLDDDAWFVGNDEISIAVTYLEQNRSVAAIAYDILSPDRPESRKRSEPQPVATFIGCGHVLRMSTVRQVGLYEITPGDYGGEEKDLCLRLMDAGYQIVRLPGVHVWHDKTRIAREEPAQHRSAVCNDLVMTLRRAPALVLPVAILAKLYAHSKFALQHGLVGSCLQGFSLFARSIPAALKTRSAVKVTTLRSFMRLARAT